MRHLRTVKKPDLGFILGVVLMSSQTCPQKTERLNLFYCQISSGTNRSLIKLRKDSLIVKYGVVVNSTFQLCPLVSHSHLCESTYQQCPYIYNPCTYYNFRIYYTDRYQFTPPRSHKSVTIPP